jgi:hypothetical protein
MDQVWGEECAQSSGTGLVLVYIVHYIQGLLLCPFFVLRTFICRNQDFGICIEERALPPSPQSNSSIVKESVSLDWLAALVPHSFFVNWFGVSLIAPLYTTSYIHYSVQGTLVPCKTCPLCSRKCQATAPSRITSVWGRTYAEMVAVVVQFCTSCLATVPRCHLSR